MVGGNPTGGGSMRIWEKVERLYEDRPLEFTGLCALALGTGFTLVHVFADEIALWTMKLWP